MRNTFLSILIFIVSLPCIADHAPIAMVIHGGAGTIRRADMSEEGETAYREALETALRTGFEILTNGGTSLDAVEATIRTMEDSPLFNSGKGAVFTHEGRNELDASIMEGKTMNAGAVAGVTILKNPISAARAVMEKSKHVMMSGRGAELFATQQGLEVVDPQYFWTEKRWKSLQKALEDEKKASSNAALDENPDHKFGTVGAVALDRDGNIAAGTSTGGMTNKRFGRIGDSPVIGAGTYAKNDTCGVSATGHGEFFIRWSVASRISDLMEYKGLSVDDAATEVVELLREVGGEGGVIALDAKGNVSMPFNSEGMYRGFVKDDGKVHIAIYGD